MLRLMTLIAALLALGVGGCGDDESRRGPPPERADRAEQPPPGWRTVRNDHAGFTLSVPRSWAVGTRGRATLIRSRDRLLAITVSADRGQAGQTQPPGRYAREVMERLPDFEGSLRPRIKRVRPSPYRNGRIDGIGALRGARGPQRITVVAFLRPHRVTYAVIGFSNARFARFNERAFARMLRSFRARPPRQRSGRSG